MPIAQRPSARKKFDRDDAPNRREGHYYTDETWNVLFGGKAPTRSPAT